MSSENVQFNATIPGTRGEQPKAKVKPSKRKLTALEWECGITEDQYRVFHAAQRERVRARFLGVKP